jgi:hypothetical protein
MWFNHQGGNGIIGYFEGQMYFRLQIAQLHWKMQIRESQFTKTSVRELYLNPSNTLNFPPFIPCICLMHLTVSGQLLIT